MFDEVWKNFTKNQDIHKLQYVTTIDPWKEEHVVKEKLIKMIETNACIKLDTVMIKKMTSPENMKMWKQAFTLPYKINMAKYVLIQNVIIEENYETIELIGDAVCNQIVSQYLYYKFNNLFSQPNYSRLVYQIDAYLHSDKVYKTFAEQLKLDELCRYDIFETETHERLPFESCLSDVYESFMGTLTLVLNDGIGMAVAQNILVKCLNKMTISTNILDYIPYTQRFNDIVRNRNLPYTILHNYHFHKQLNQHVLEILVLSKMNITKDLKDEFMNKTFQFKHEKGYKKMISQADKEDVFKQMIQYFESGYNLFWCETNNNEYENEDE